jgi:hypothetical protein
MRATLPFTGHCAIALACGMGWTVAAAADLDFTIGGAFNGPNDVLLIEFSDVDGLFATFTSQWNGGSTPNGPALPAADPAIDGFDAVLSVYFGIGDGATLSGFTDTGGEGIGRMVGGTLFTGGARDAASAAGVAPGVFTLALTNAFNLPVGPTLGDGFDGQGDDGSGGDVGFTGPEFRVHLRAIDEILGVRAPNPVSISGPFDTVGMGS